MYNFDHHFQSFVPETHEEMMETAFQAAITVGCMRIAGTSKYKKDIFIKLLYKSTNKFYIA